MSASAAGPGQLLDVKGYFKKNCPAQHKLALAGFAELIHNAADADAQRLDVLLERASKPGWEDEYLITFRDNGYGMELEELKQMLKIGSSKGRATGEIGKWGVGFKNGTLRNAEGALVFTRADASGTMSVALFSPDYIIDEERKGAAKQTAFPILSFAADMKPLHSSAEVDEFWNAFDIYAPLSRRHAYRILTSLPTVLRDLNGAQLPQGQSSAGLSCAVPCGWLVSAQGVSVARTLSSTSCCATPTAIGCLSSLMRTQLPQRRMQARVRLISSLLT